MRIEFKKIPYSKIDFEVSLKNIKLSGAVTKISKNLVKCVATLKGSFLRICDRCGEEFLENIDEEIEIYISNGIYEGDFLDVIEFFDDFVDFDYILQNEIESYNSDYLYCTKCKT